MKYFISFACLMTGFLMWATTAVNYFTKSDATQSLSILGLGILNGILASAFLWSAIDSVIEYVKALNEKEDGK